MPPPNETTPPGSLPANVAPMDVEGTSIFGDMNYLIGVIRQSTQSLVRAVLYSTLVSCLVWSIFVSEVYTPPPSPSLPSGVEYKVVSWNPLDSEDGAYDGSKSSFVNVARQEGLTDEDIFTTCSYPKGSLYAFPMSRAEMSVVDCVLGKLINFIAHDRWTLLQGVVFSRGGQATPLTFYTLYFQRNA